jgi:hypothetical protein
MLLWRRLHNADAIVEALGKQTDKDFDFVLWFNDDKGRDDMHFRLSFDHACKQAGIRGHLIHEHENHGSKARFWAAKWGVQNLYGESVFLQNVPIIFFDDDQIPLPDFVEYMMGRFRMAPRAIHAQHNRRFFSESYINEAYLMPSGRSTDYCGTGGMVLPSDIVLDSRIQNTPAWIADAEDLWLSYIARMEYDLALYGCEKKIEHVVDEHDQFWTIGQKKEAYFKKLRDMGWRLLKDSQPESALMKAGGLF